MAVNRKASAVSPDDTGKPNKLPTEAGDCSLFNDYVWLLLNLLHRNRHKTRLRDFDAEDRAALKDYEEEIDVFLWELCLHQTPQVELAAAAVDETRKALHDLLRRAGCGSWLESVAHAGPLICMGRTCGCSCEPARACDSSGRGWGW